jgi:hypothetical protein
VRWPGFEHPTQNGSTYHDRLNSFESIRSSLMLERIFLSWGSQTFF